MRNTSVLVTLPPAVVTVIFAVPLDGRACGTVTAIWVADGGPTRTALTVTAPAPVVVNCTLTGGKLKFEPFSVMFCPRGLLFGVNCGGWAKTGAGVSTSARKTSSLTTVPPWTPRLVVAGWFQTAPGVPG